MGIYHRLPLHSGLDYKTLSTVSGGTEMGSPASYPIGRIPELRLG